MAEGPRILSQLFQGACRSDGDGAGRGWRAATQASRRRRRTSPRRSRGRASADPRDRRPLRRRGAARPGGREEDGLARLQRPLDGAMRCAGCGGCPRRGRGQRRLFVPVGRCSGLAVALIFSAHGSAGLASARRARPAPHAHGKGRGVPRFAAKLPLASPHGAGPSYNPSRTGGQRTLRGRHRRSAIAYRRSGVARERFSASRRGVDARSAVPPRGAGRSTSSRQGLGSRSPPAPRPSSRCWFPRRR